jgi:hypothetical protein
VKTQLQLINIIIIYYYYGTLGGSRKTKKQLEKMVIKEAGRSWNELRFLAADRSGNNT